MVKSEFIRSTLWSILGRYIPNFLQIVSTLVIARLVTPKEFGEVAIITIFIQIASLLVSSGFHEALVYRVNNSQILYSTVFYTNVAISALLYILLFVFSDYIASFYLIPRLSILTKVVGVNIIAYSLTYIQKVILTIEINFKTPALISLISSLCGCIIGLILAFNNYGVWALVWQTLSINLIQLILFWIISKWKPLFKFSIKGLVSILPYSYKILMNNIVQTLYDNMYALVIGKYFSSQTLGYYNRMQTVAFFTTANFMYAIESVFYPVLCRKKENKSELVRNFKKILRISAYLAFPVLIILLSLGESIIIALLTSKWLGGVVILKMLSIAYLFVPIIYTNNSFLKILNKPGVLFYTGIIKKIIGGIILILTLPFGIEYVCLGIIIYYALDAIISMICTSFFLGVNLFKQVKELISIIILNISLYFIITNVTTLVFNVWFKIVLGVFVGGISYFSLSHLFGVKEFLLIRDILLKKNANNNI